MDTKEIGPGPTQEQPAVRGSGVDLCGYGRIAVVPRDEEELTRVGFGTPMGELLRRYWHPVCLSEELKDLPKKLMIMGEEQIGRAHV